MNLLDLKNSEFDRSEFWQNFYFACGGLVYVVGIFMVLLQPHGSLVTVFAIVTTLIQLSSIYFRYKSAIHSDLADQIRRRNDFAFALGIQPTKEEVEDWYLRVKVITPGKVENEQYFDTDITEHGTKKLLETIRGSSFFTSYVARRAAQIYGFVAVLGFLLSIVILFLFVLFEASHATLEKVSQAVIVSMGFWVAGEFAWSALSYHRLSQAATRIRDRCAELLRASRDVSTEEAIVLVGEYNVAAAQSPPLPKWVYKMLQNKLNGVLKK
jgi:hypothetical protein